MDFDKPKVYGDTSITDGLVLFDVSSHPEDVADVLVVVGESEEDWQHEEVAADDDVRFVTLCDGHCHYYV